MLKRPFTGCNFAQFSSNGTINSAFTVVNTNKSAKNVDKCLYSTAFAIFGFEPSGKMSDGLDAPFDLSAIRALYRLDERHRQIGLLGMFLARAIIGR
jgi:hypothetical protein